MKYFIIHLWLLFSLLSIALFSQIDKGTIKGKVFDPEYGNIIGANVIVMQTNLGAAVDTNGNYIIRNVPFGQYEIRCSYIGYPSKIDTILVSKENPEVILDSELTIPKIPIVMPDSLQQYHNLISTLDQSKILEITIDSVSKNFEYTYVTFTNKTKYPIYLVEDMYCFNTVDEVLKDSKGEELSSNIVNMGCGDF
ncbi:MAG: carboxypeptidase-like regulatory domain-containing protein [Ignavibacteriaceae bacterium]|nr:carboxypeptidase-like regulatory domain-containing protein [Ignavibacteriaceae bacterium]